MTVMLNSTEVSQKELEQGLKDSLPSAHPGLKFGSIQLNMVQTIVDADLYLMPTNSKLLINSISLDIEDQQVPMLVLGEGTSNGKVFYSEASSKSYFEALSGLAKSQNMRKIGVIFSSNEVNLDAIEYFKNNDFITVSASLDKNADQGKVSELLGRFFKSKGITDYLVLVDHNLCNKLELSFSELKINKKWNIVIYGKECIGQLEKEGSIVVVPEGLETVETFNDYGLKSFDKNLNLLNGKNLESHQITKIFQKEKSLFEFSVINIKSGQSVVVGHISNGNIEMISSIVYPSGLSQREIVAKVPIRLSANTGIANSPGYPYAYQNAKYHQGTYFMLDKVRKTNQNFAKFDLQLFDNITCGVSYFDYNYSRDCYLKIKDELGIAHIPSFYDSTIQTLHQFKDLDINIPIISGMGNNFEGSDISVFNNYFRLVSPSKYCTFQGMFLMKKHDWTDLIVFYSDDTWSQHHYNYLLYFESIGLIKIVNQEKYRKIPFDYSPEMSKNYTDHIKDALSTGCNILSLAMSDPVAFKFLESIAEYGVEFGEFMIFLYSPNGQDAGTAEDANFKLRKKLLHGTFFGYDSFWEGEYGAQIKAEYEKSEYTSYLPGFYIDTVSTITKTLEYMLDLGKDYEDTESFVEALSQIRFVGVTGRVSFESATHTRNRYACNTYNLYYDSQLEKYVMNWVIKVDPLSKLYFLALTDEVWFTNTIFYPNSKTVYHNCPYFTENIVDSQISETPEFTINLIILIGSAIISMFILIKLKLKNTQLVSQIMFINVFDLIQMIIIVLEPLQLITIGPSFKNITRELSLIVGLLSLNLMKFYSLRDNS